MQLVKRLLFGALLVWAYLMVVVIPINLLAGQRQLDVLNVLWLAVALLIVIKHQRDRRARRTA